MRITDDIHYIGVNDHKIDLFESMYTVPNGISYNSYVITDEKIAVMDTVDASFTDEWLENLKKTLENKTPDYLIVQHMEPDHSGSIIRFIEMYPDAEIVSSEQSFKMIKNFFKIDLTGKKIVVSDGSTLNLGVHMLRFIAAPMVHWPEVIVTYDIEDKVLFSADAFGKFGALDREEEWADEARRYYIGIVGKYGIQVQKLLSRIAELEINTICPLHGPVLQNNLSYYLSLYNRWSNYQPETDGVMIAYTSVYGNTKKAVMILSDLLKENGCQNILLADLAREDMPGAVANAFRYNKLVLATTTYNADIFPPMRQFISHLRDRNFSNRTVALIENGSWFPLATKVMKELLEKCNGITFLNTNVRILSALNEESTNALYTLAEELCSNINH